MTRGLGFISQKRLLSKILYIGQICLYGDILGCLVFNIGFRSKGTRIGGHHECSHGSVGFDVFAAMPIYSNT